MNISEYIKSLEDIRKEHGDLDIAKRHYTGHSTDVYIRVGSSPSCILELVGDNNQKYLEDINDCRYNGDSKGKPTKKYLVVQKGVA